MTTSHIPPIGPNYGIGRVTSNSQGKKKGQNFQEAFADEASEEEQPAPQLPTRILQPKQSIRRRESEDGGHHIDVIA